MNIKIRLDKLTFIDLTDDQLKIVLELSSNFRVKSDKGEVLVFGSKSDLYKLLYKLSYDYDIELY